MAAQKWNSTLKRLEGIKLLVIQPDGGVDCHPLLREYFGGGLREYYPEAWRAAHKRLFEHLGETTREGDQPTLEDLQPLYQAVAHGCRAGLQQEALYKVYVDRILRGTGSGGFYSWKKLGAFGSNLGAVACFFETPWHRVSPALSEAAQAWLLNETAIQLRALGRMTEALEPMRAGLEMRIKQEDWENAAISAGSLSELELTLGRVTEAVEDGDQAVTHADRSGDAFERMGKRTTHGDGLHQGGWCTEAEARFRQAEQLQAEGQPDYPLLYSLWGFRYCDLLLSKPERAAGNPAGPSRRQELVAECRAVAERAAQTLKWIEHAKWLLDIALDHLTLGRTALYGAILEQVDFQHPPPDLAHIDHAVDGLRRSGQQDYLPCGLLTRAWLRSLTGPPTGPESAQADLDEAWEIAERGSMVLHMADIHLHRARLFFRQTKYPWQSPQTDLAAARHLIKKHGYLRRLPELEDAEMAIRETFASGSS